MKNLALIGQAVSEKKIFENGGRRTDGRRTDGRTTEHGYTISSPCEPDGSGELKMLWKTCFSVCNSRTILFQKMLISYYYKESFYLSNGALFEMIALTEAWKINVKFDWSSLHFSQNCHKITQILRSVFNRKGLAT